MVVETPACASAAPIANSDPPITNAVAATAFSSELRRDEGLRVGADALTAVEFREFGHLLVAQLEIEDVDVLAYPLRRRRLGNDDVAKLQVPAQDHLGNGPAVPLGDAGDR